MRVKNGNNLKLAKVYIRLLVKEVYTQQPIRICIQKKEAIVISQYEFIFSLGTRKQ